MGKSIYLVLDMENDLIHADGPNANGPYGEQVKKRGIIEKTAKAIKKARDAGLLIGFVRVGFSSDYRECPKDSPIFSGARKNGIFKIEEWGGQIHPDLGMQDTDFDIIKHRVSPFYSTSLEAILRANDIERIYCSGISTNAVVQSMVREGHDRDYQMVVLEDCCCGMSAEEHDIAITSLKRFCTISNSEDVIFE